MMRTDTYHHDFPSLFTVAPVITFPPVDYVLIVDQFQEVTFSCGAAGIPAPVISWSRELEGGDTMPLLDSTSISLQDPVQDEDYVLPAVMGVVFGVNRSLVLNEVRDEDSGFYFCVANSSTGEASTRFQLLVQGQSIISTLTNNIRSIYSFQLLQTSLNSLRTLWSHLQALPPLAVKLQDFPCPASPGVTLTPLHWCLVWMGL